MVRIHARVGRLRQVVPAALAFSFEAAARGTAAEGAELRIEAVPARGRCGRCGAEQPLPSFPLRCAACGSLEMRITAGDELLVESLDLEVREETEDGGPQGLEVGGRARRDGRQ